MTAHAAPAAAPRTPAASAPPGDEPLFVTVGFDRNPIAGTVAAIVAHTRAAAAAAVPRSRPAERALRTAVACELLAEASADEVLCDEAREAAHAATFMAAEAPAATLDGVLAKLAAATRANLSACNPAYTGPVMDFALLASALADLVLLRAGPIALPPDVPLHQIGPADVPHWRAVAARQAAAEAAPAPAGAA